jgi:hypothetical protein
MLESAASCTRSYVMKFWNAHRSTGRIFEDQPEEVLGL